MTELNWILREKLQSVERIATTALASQPHGDEECGEHICKAIAEIRKEIGCESCGNAAAMREALVAIQKLVQANIAADEFDDLEPLKEYVQIRDICNTALTEPARNCDIHTDFNDAITTLANKRNWHDGKWDSERYCILASWLLAPAAERKGECDGSK